MISEHESFQTIMVEPVHNGLRSFVFGGRKNEEVIEIIDTRSVLDQKINTRVHIKKNSDIRYIFLIDESAHGDFFEDREITVEDHCRLNSFFCYLGGHFNKVKVRYHIKSHSQIFHNVIFFAHRGKKFEFEDIYEFLEPGSFGRFLIKGFTAGDSSSDFFGKIRIYPYAQKVDSRLEMESHIIGPNARGSMVPSLQVEANDVKAGHAAKISKIDEEHLFYMRSRGLTQKDAMHLFFEGLFIEFTKRFSNQGMAHRILNAVGRISSTII